MSLNALISRGRPLSRPRASWHVIPLPISKTVLKEKTSPTIQPVPKKSRPAMKSYSDIVKGHRRVAVIDRADNNGTITPDKWRKVEAKLNTVPLDILREYPDSDARF